MYHHYKNTAELLIYSSDNFKNSYIFSIKRALMYSLLSIKSPKIDSKGSILSPTYTQA